jgi:hypothetical protein
MQLNNNKKKYDDCDYIIYFTNQINVVKLEDAFALLQDSNITHAV